MCLWESACGNVPMEMCLWKCAYRNVPMGICLWKCAQCAPFWATSGRRFFCLCFRRPFLHSTALPTPRGVSLDSVWEVPHLPHIFRAHAPGHRQRRRMEGLMPEAQARKRCSEVSHGWARRSSVELYRALAVATDLTNIDTTCQTHRVVTPWNSLQKCTKGIP